MNLLVELFFCSIAENFYSLFEYDLDNGLVKINHNSQKYSAIIHNKNSNKINLFSCQQQKEWFKVGTGNFTKCLPLTKKFSLLPYIVKLSPITPNNYLKLQLIKTYF